MHPCSTLLASLEVSSAFFGSVIAHPQWGLAGAQNRLDSARVSALHPHNWHRRSPFVLSSWTSMPQSWCWRLLLRLLVWVSQQNHNKCWHLVCAQLTAELCWEIWVLLSVNWVANLNPSAIWVKVSFFSFSAFGSERDVKPNRVWIRLSLLFWGVNS